VISLSSVDNSHSPEYDGGVSLASDCGSFLNSAVLLHHEWNIILTHLVELLLSRSTNYDPHIFTDLTVFASTIVGSGDGSDMTAI
jgi:hypothetical protein